MHTPTTTQYGYLTSLRVVIIVQTATVFAASVTAGLLLTYPGGKWWHSASAYALFVVALVHVAAALLAWRPGGGTPRPVYYAVAFLIGVLAQVALGIAHVKVLHVPLALLLFGGSVLLLAWIWNIEPQRSKTTKGNDRVHARRG